MQPATIDGGAIVDDKYGVAVNRRRVPLQDEDNRVDAAIARLTDDRIACRYQPGIGTPKDAVGEPSVGTVVEKGRTRTTSYRKAEVIGTDARINVNYGDGVKQFTEQIITKDMSKAGDSGSVGYFNGKPFGLLFAGSSKVTVYNPMQTVLDELDVSLNPEFEVVDK